MTAMAGGRAAAKPEVISPIKLLGDALGVLRSGFPEVGLAWLALTAAGRVYN